MRSAAEIMHHLLPFALGCLGPALIHAAEPEPKIYRGHVEPHWLGENVFWYRNDLPAGNREFVLVDASNATRLPAFDHARAAAALGPFRGQDGAAPQLPVELLEFSPSRDSVVLHGRSRSWRLNLASYEVSVDRGAAAIIPPGSEPNTALEWPILFINRSGGKLDVHRFAATGGERPVRELLDTARWETKSAAGDVWLVTAPSGRTRTVLRGMLAPLTVAIGSEDVSLSPDLPSAAPPPTSVRSPNGKWEAVVREHNLWLRATSGSETFALSFDGSPGNTFRHDTSRSRLVRMQYDLPESPHSRPDVVWSPDSTHLVALQTRQVPERRVQLIESSPRDQLQPRPQSYPYLKPGDEIPTPRPRLFEVGTQREIAINASLFLNPWDLTQLRWQSDSSSFTFLYNQRGHQVLRLVAVDAATGAARAMVEERSDTFIHYSGAASFHEQIARTGEVVWTSERSGWNHLYLFDASSGQLKHALTRGDWTVRSVDRVDPAARVVWFFGGGIVPGQDPYHAHLCRVNFDGSELAVLTSGDGTHSVRWSPMRSHFIDTWTRVDLPPVAELRRARDGALVCALETADASEVLARHGQWPERFVAKGRDGATDIHGIIHRPRSFDPTKSYPVIERIYAGPHGFHVPKDTGPRTYDPLVERGFIVVQIDGMGTAGRSKKFHDVCWKNLADAGFPDRIAWIRAAAAKFPGFDLTRVGIYGTSAGAQSALGALLWHGDFYHAAASDCGCHDNRMDKIWWNEQWLGWPVGPHYAASSNVTHAHLLRGKLFLAVGELDRNVDPSSTYQVADALVRADKSFEYLVMPGAGHGVFRTSYGRKRLEDFFVKTFLSLKP